MRLIVERLVRLLIRKYLPDMHLSKNPVRVKKTGGQDVRNTSNV